MADEKKAKVKHHKTSMVHKDYEAKGGNLERKNRFCPKCGTGFFMAKHKDRLTCGNCHYTEFVKKEK